MADWDEPHNPGSPAMADAAAYRNRISELEAKIAGRSAAVNDVIAERERQKAIEGYSDEHDDEQDGGQMASAAAAYALHDIFGGFFAKWHWVVWPWDRVYWKPSSRRRDLVKAGALIIAEIERLDRRSSVEIE